MAIAIRKSDNIQSSLESIISELAFIPGKRVLIKPNLCGRMPIKPGENTSIPVLDALIDVLLKWDCQVTIGHGALLGSEEHKTTFDETLVQSGFSKYRESKHVKIINIDELERDKVVLDGFTFHLPMSYFVNQVDTYINLSKLKTHMETQVSLSLKNQMGFPLPDDRVNMHKHGLNKYIALLAKVIKPDLNIIEGFPAMENNGPHHGTPKDTKIIAGSNDMVELDSFICQLIGLDPTTVEHIKMAYEFGVGVLSDQYLVSQYSNYIIPDFKLASRVFKYGRTIRAYPGYSCSMCINAVNNAGKEFKKHPVKYRSVLLKSMLSKHPINIVFGAPDGSTFENGHSIYIGSCVKSLADADNSNCLDECPPKQSDVIQFIVENIRRQKG